MRIPLSFAIPVLFLAACSSPTSPKPVKTDPVSTSLNMGSTVPQVQNAAVVSDDNQKVSLTLNLNSSQRVYFVLTNESATSATSGMPTMAGDTAPTSPRSAAAVPKVAVKRPRLADAPPDFVQQFNSKAGARLIAGPRNRSAASPSSDSAPTSPAVIGTTTTSCIPPGGSAANAITCTLAAVVDQSLANGGSQQRKLFVWVANSCFENSTSAGTYTYTTQTSASSIPFKVNKSQAQALADKFLSTSNDIYSYDTSIYGAEYGNLGSGALYPNLITPQGEIHIFLLDLNSTSSYKGDGGTLGYFYGADDFIKGSGGASDSNQKIMFRLDAQTFGNPTGDGSLPTQTGTDQSGWSVSTSYWPNQIQSTLAHEFQHMIQFYQKGIVVRGDGSSADTWINEMCSVVTEDFVGSNIQSLGPRGVAFTNTGHAFAYSPLTGTVITLNSAGTAVTSTTFNDPGSRVAFFNEYYPTVSLESWGDTGSGKLANYGMAFAFGSWLARNYGGPQLFHDIVANQYTDEQAVVTAVNNLNTTSYTMPQLIEQWAAAMVMGSQATTDASPSTGRYAMVSTSSDGYFTAGTFTYGSIDATTYYPYYYDAANNSNSGLDMNLGSGPLVFNTLSAVKSIPARAFYYYTPSTGALTAGTYAYTITIPSHVHFDVVTVPSS